METIDLTIEGMTCEHCVRAVRGALEQMTEVKVESVDVGSARVQVNPDRVTVDDLADAIADEGYTAYRSED